MAFHYPAAGLNLSWNPHYVQLLGLDSFRSICCHARGYPQRNISLLKEQCGSQGLCLSVKAVGAPQFPFTGLFFNLIKLRRGKPCSGIAGVRQRSYRYKLHYLEPLYSDFGL